MKMARKVTDKDIIDMNEAYLLCKTYSGVVTATGWSASTVRKYIIPGYTSKKEKINYNITIPSIEETIKSLLANEALCNVTEEERANLPELWEGMLI